MLRAALQQRQRGAVGHHGLPALDQALLRSTIASVCPLSLLGTPSTPETPETANFLELKSPPRYFCAFEFENALKICP